MPQFEPYDVRIHGLTMGSGHSWVCTEISVPELAYVTQDANLPRRDGTYFGRDYLDPGSWGLTVQPTFAHSGRAVEAVLPELVRAWSFDQRDVPGAYTELEYQLESGDRRVVYGRPRGLAVDPNGMRYGSTEVGLTFDLTDSLAYRAEAQRLPLVLLPPAPAGFRFPAWAPFLFGAGSHSRQGVIVNAGPAPTPLKVTFEGPVTNPTVRSLTHGWELSVQTTLAYDRSVTVDTRSMTVRRDDGASLAHRLTRHSDLGARVAPGADEIVYEGLDSTGSSRAVVEWHEAMGPF